MTREQKFVREVVLPGIFPISIILVTIGLIVLVGETLLHVTSEDATSEFRRPELWIATLTALAILGVAAFVATRPPGSMGRLDEELAIGSRPLLAEPLPPVDAFARHGRLGTIDDIGLGYALYARNGQLGIARELLRDTPTDVGHLRMGFVYAQGVHGANDEMWIPLEAISAVYPESQSAFLAIAGDEMEAYGWQNPPASFNLYRKSEQNTLY